MNALPTRRLPVAWILLALILFNGLACSIGHGQMLKAFSVGERGAGHGGGHAMPGAGEHHAGMHHSAIHASDASKTLQKVAGSTSTSAPMAMPMFEDCSFAATLTLALVFFVALGWLQRSRQPRVSAPCAWHLRPLRHCSSGLNPHAP